MIGKKLFILITLILSLNSAAASETKILLSSNQRDIAPGDIFTVELIVEGQTDAEIIRIENLDKFNVEGQSTSSSYKFINGKSSREKVISYELSLRDINNNKDVYFGPAVFKVNGKEVNSNYLVFNLKKSPGGKVRQGGVREAQEKLHYFLDVQIDDKQLFVNQKTLLTLKFYNSVEFAEANLVTPESDKFWLEQSGKQENSREIINGKAYKVTTVKYFFTPLVSGQLNLDGFSINGLAIIPTIGKGGRNFKGRRGFGLDSFFDDSFFRSRGKRRRVSLKAKPINLVITDIPTVKQNEKINFDGVVGQFKVRELEIPSKISSDDSLVFSFIVSGDGNLDLLKFDKNVADFKVFKDKDEKIILPGGDLEEARRISYLLVPLKTGTVRAPIFSAKYFDPHDQHFKELQVGGSEIEVYGKIKSNETRPAVPEVKKITVDNVKKSKRESLGQREGISITEPSIVDSIVSQIMKLRNVIFLLSAITVIASLLSLLNLRITKIFTFLFSVKLYKNQEMKKVRILVKSLLNQSFSTRDIDSILKIILNNRYKPLRRENLNVLRNDGAGESDILALEKIYEEAEHSIFAEDGKSKKLSKFEEKLLLRIAKHVIGRKKIMRVYLFLILFFLPTLTFSENQNESLIVDKKFDELIEVISKKKDRNWEDFFYLSIAYEKKMQHRKALLNVIRAMSLNPMNSDLYFNADLLMKKIYGASTDTSIFEVFKVSFYILVSILIFVILNLTFWKVKFARVIFSLIQIGFLYIFFFKSMSGKIVDYRNLAVLSSGATVRISPSETSSRRQISSGHDIVFSVRKLRDWILVQNTSDEIGWVNKSNLIK